MILTALVGAPVVAVAVYLFVSLKTPSDAPLARMYRTEADLASLAKAVDVYYADHGQYPSAGESGLRLATDHLSRKVDYFAGGPLRDAWGQPYTYAPHSQYPEPEAGALEANGEYFAADTYQIYSAGADGEPGIDKPHRRLDNICSWDKSRSWRPVYRELDEVFSRRRKSTP